MAQSRYLIKAAQRQKVPTIIAGDFNLLPDTESIRLLGKHFRNLTLESGAATTRPVNEYYRGGSIVDFIFVNDDIEVQDFRIAGTNMSDHLPLVLEFTVRT